MAFLYDDTGIIISWKIDKFNILNFPGFFFDNKFEQILTCSKNYYTIEFLLKKIMYQR